MYKPIDYDIRETAVTEQSKNIVVTAGAGAGKTTILVRRLLHLLLAHRKFSAEESPILKIVALTFTEKAANDMKVRLMEELERIVTVIKGNSSHEETENFLDHLRDTYKTPYSEIKRRALKSIEDMDKMIIGTIHSFAATILRMYPVESGVVPGFVIDKGDMFEEVFEREWTAWLDTQLSLTCQNANTWKEILKRIGLDSVKGLTKQLAGFSIPHDSLSLTKSEPDFIQSMLRPLCTEISNTISLCENPRNKLLIQLQEYQHIFDMIINQGVYYVQHLEYDFEKNISTAKAGWQDGGCATAQSVAKKCKSLLKKLRTVDESLINTLVDMVFPFAQNFRRLYLSQGYVTFDGLLTLTKELLQNEAFRYVRNTLKHEYRAILVDEFQDTDPIQYEIVLFLSEDVKNYNTYSHNVVPEPGKLFIVGDPKQSIYAFRRADIEAYEHVVKQIYRDEEPLKLQENFRSHRGIVDVVNELFDNKIITELPGLQPRYIPIHARRPCIDHFQRVEIVSVSDEEGKPLLADTARKAEAEWIANWIKENVNKTTLPGNNGKDLLRYKDIALLLRSINQVKPYVEAFRDNEIPFIIDGEKYFYTTEEIIDFMNLLMTIENPHDTLALVGVLRSPVVGLTDNEIYELRRKDLLDYRREIPEDIGFKEIIENFYLLLRKFRERAGMLPVSELISEILGTIQYTIITASTWQGEQRLANLRKLYQIAHEMEQLHGISLKYFIRSVKERIEETKEEGENPLADETLDVVKIITIHKSKGLEFPVVIMGNLHHETRKDFQIIDKAVYDWSSSSTGIVINAGRQEIRNLQSILIEQKLIDRLLEEEKRILYVAMTRAKERLILTGSLKDDNKSHMGLIVNSLQDFPGFEFPFPETNCDNGNTRRIALYNAEIFYENFTYDGTHNRTDAKKEKVCDVDWGTFVQTWEERKALMNKEAQTPLFISPTTLTEKDAQVENISTDREKYDDESSFLQKYAPLIGTLCHQILNEWDFQGTKGSLQELLETLLALEHKEAKLSQQEARLIKAEVAHIFQPFFHSEAYEDLRMAHIMGREVPLLLHWEGRIMRGAIDIIYEINNQIIIADYKTDRVVSLNNPTYQNQKKVYTEAVKRCLHIDNPTFKLIYLRQGKAFFI